MGRQPVIAIDVDGVLARYHGYTGSSPDDIGEVLPGAGAALAGWSREGMILVPWTCRATWAVEEWCRRNNLPIDAVNRNPQWPNWAEVGGSPKMIADFYLDDRAIEVPTNNPDWGALRQRMSQMGIDRHVIDQTQHERMVEDGERRMG